MDISGGIEWIVVLFVSMLVYVLLLAFMVFVIALLIKIHKTVTSLQEKIEKLKQAQTE